MNTETEFSEKKKKSHFIKHLWIHAYGIQKVSLPE